MISRDLTHTHIVLVTHAYRDVLLIAMSILSIVVNSTLTISWALVDGVTATSYSISYSATDTDCIPGSITIPDIAGSETMYRLTGLEEGTEYSITVTTTLTGGGSQQAMVEGTTVAAGECISMQSNLF